MSLIAFSDASELAAISSGRYTGNVSAEWTIGGRPNGGYLLAMLGRAAADAGPHEHVIAASAHYLRSPDPASVDIEVEVLRAGRSASQLRARMLQEGQLCVEALFTTSNLDPESKAYWDRGLPTPEIADWEDCIRIPARTPIGVPVAIMEQVECRLDPAILGFASGHPSGDGAVQGWLALPYDETFDPLALLFAADALPPATFAIEVTGWVPTLEFTVYVRALAAPGPVRIWQHAQLIDGQRVDETCFVWDRTGRLVAQSTQLAGIRLG